MFDIGGSEALIIVLAILLLFGAKRIPDLAKSLGAGIREFRRAMADISSEVQSATSIDPVAPQRPLAPVLPPPENSLPQLSTILAEQSAAREAAMGAPPSTPASVAHPSGATGGVPGAAPEPSTVLETTEHASPNVAGASRAPAVAAGPESPGKPAP